MDVVFMFKMTNRKLFYLFSSLFIAGFIAGYAYTVYTVRVTELEATKATNYYDYYTMTSSPEP